MTLPSHVITVIAPVTAYSTFAQLLSSIHVCDSTESILTEVWEFRSAAAQCRFVLSLQSSGVCMHAPHGKKAETYCPQGLSDPQRFPYQQETMLRFLDAPVLCKLVTNRFSSGQISQI